MRRWNLVDDFKKLKDLLLAGKFGELKTRVFTIIPPLCRWQDRVVVERMHKKYDKFIDDHAEEYRKNYVQGGGHRDTIWWLWFQGVDKAPDICKACLASLRRWFPEKEIITLDSTNIPQYVTLPEHITRKHEQGKIIHAHYSDMLRLQLLTEHGGTWIDSTIFCTGRKTAYVMDQSFFTFRGGLESIELYTPFFVSDPNNPILALTRDILFDYWREHNYYTHYFIFNIIFDMAAQRYKEYYERMLFMNKEVLSDISFALKNNEDYSDERMKEFAEQSDFHKITYKKVTDDCMLPSKFLPNLIRLYNIT